MVGGLGLRKARLGGSTSLGPGYEARRGGRSAQHEAEKKEKENQRKRKGKGKEKEKERKGGGTRGGGERGGVLKLKIRA